MPAKGDEDEASRAEARGDYGEQFVAFCSVGTWWSDNIAANVSRERTG